MADPTQLSSAGYLGSAVGNVLGTGGTNTQTAANTTFQYGQYQPYSVNNPLGQTSFSNGTATSTMSPLQQQLTSQFGNQISSNLSNPATSSYNPNTSFLPQQYQSIFGNMQGNANSMFNSLQAAQQPFTSQYLQSNLDNEQSKGTLASTAGAYQTAGAQTAANSQMNQNQATAQQYALQNAQAQFSAAGTTASQGEQQAEFAPQIAQQQNTADYSNLLNSSSLLNQQASLGGSLGALQSNANTSALQNNFSAAQQQDQAQSGLLNGLLTGNGTGGLLSSLLGTSTQGGTSGGVLGGIGTSAGNFLNSLFSGGTVSGSAASTGSLGGTSLAAPNVAGDVGSPGSGLDLSSGNVDLSGGSDSGGTDQQLTDQELEDLGFNGAGGQAATGTSQGGPTLNDNELTSLYGSPTSNPFNPIGAAASGIGLASSVSAGSGAGAAGAAAGLASSLGAPSSLTNPVSLGASAASLGQNIASGNILGALSSAIGLGGKAGLPSYITQPAGLLTSILSGNPIGMAVNALGVGKGVMNLIQGANYNGSIPSVTPYSNDLSQGLTNADGSLNTNYLTAAGATQQDIAQFQSMSDQASLAPVAASIQSNAATQAYMLNNANSFYGQGSNDVFNQGEAITPVAPLSPQASQDASMTEAMQQYANDPTMLALIKASTGTV